MADVVNFSPGLMIAGKFRSDRKHIYKTSSGGEIIGTLGATVSIRQTKYGTSPLLNWSFKSGSFTASYRRSKFTPAAAAPGGSTTRFSS